MTMLEVIYTEETSQEAIDIMCMVGDAQDKAISLVRDMPGTYGFILNRVFAAAFREGAKIVQDGIATREVSPTIPPPHTHTQTQELMKLPSRPTLPSR